ncbi:protein phosphatase 1 regulatory subunit 3B isoform X1 [Diorhabda carinulata]|uniref:protein phosphatase 1 regulatory subunit 3B isoform X1 n=2 Tax=Diorhabda carinulata TaxID=1163345 RepID=UPI0025A1443D|nr:protein phosphatase 1 regulatory subunit 3B isoform X1 [Diorhabda carinulata]
MLVQMCSMDYEMLVSHSPPVFSHSPPTGFLKDYAALRLGADFPRATYTSSTCRSLHHSNSFNTLPKTSFKMPAYPKRPCLVIRATEESSSSSDEDPTSPTRLKKKVVFADDKGMSLTHVRVMTEPSHVPPLWSYRFLSNVTQGLNKETVGEIHNWEITFPQPASDYVAFRKRLDTENVSLENVIIKEAEDNILGTIKVRNLAFHKEVFVRCSSNEWRSHEDCFCTYVPNNMNTNINVLYDTFSFKIQLPVNAKKLEFCVCFKCEGKEYWDSNDSKNYTIVKKSSLNRSFSNDDIFKRKEQDTQASVRKCNDIVQAKMESWSEFASWTHLENNSPYW